MPIKVTLDAVLARRGMTARDLSGRIGISETQLSLFRSGKVRGLRFATLARICAVLRCHPGDLLDYLHDPGDMTPPGEGAAVEEL
jgi:putative transcriptional regulator